MGAPRGPAGPQSVRRARAVSQRLEALSRTLTRDGIQAVAAELQATPLPPWLQVSVDPDDPTQLVAAVSLEGAALDESTTPEELEAELPKAGMATRGGRGRPDKPHQGQRRGKAVLVAPPAHGRRGATRPGRAVVAGPDNRFRRRTKAGLERLLAVAGVRHLDGVDGQGVEIPVRADAGAPLPHWAGLPKMSPAGGLVINVNLELAKAEGVDAADLVGRFEDAGYVAASIDPLPPATLTDSTRVQLTRDGPELR